MRLVLGWGEKNQLGAMGTISHPWKDTNPPKINFKVICGGFDPIWGVQICTGCTRTVRTPKYAFPRIYTPFHGAAPITIYVKKRITQWLASICAILGEYVGALTPEHSELPGAILHPPRYQPLWPLQRPAEDQQLDSPGLGSR